MKLLQDMFAKLYPLYKDGGKLERLKPLFDAQENFFFSSDEVTEVAPHIRDPLDLKRFMTMVIIAVLPCFILGVHHFGLRIIAMTIVSYAVGGTVEVIFSVVRKEPISEGFLVTGLLFPLILPPGLPLWAVAVGVAFGVLVGKEVFGGTGYNLFNPALVGRCFLTIGYPSVMAQSYMEPGQGALGKALTWATDTTTGATPLGQAKQLIKAAAESTDQSDILAKLPPVSDLVLGNISGCVGEVSALLILIGGLFLLATRVANWRTVAGIFASFIILGGICHQMAPETFAPVQWHLFAGGLFFGAFFMATDPVTSPTSNGGKLVYGILVGCVIVLIRNLTGYVEGTMFAILFGNIVAPLFDEVAVRIKIRRLPKC